MLNLLFSLGPVFSLFPTVVFCAYIGSPHFVKNNLDNSFASAA